MPSNTIEGIISGLNTTEIIDSIVQYERRPAVLMENDKTEKTNIVTTLKALQAKIFAAQAKAQQLSYKTTFQKATISVSDESYLTATANGRVATGSYDLQVRSVARNHQIASQGFSAEDIAAFGTGTIQLAVGGASARTITIDAGNNTLTGIKEAINNARIGVTATIVNDGSTSNQYRLILSADKTGISNRITVTSDLSGGPDFNFATASFDAPEAVLMSTASSSQISLGATAAFTGSTNKTYTFTVQGTGSQVLGTDNITLGWTDGTNSGSIIVTQADVEVELVGAGANGLKLSLSSGELNGGDVFQVQSFAPLLQQASNAMIAFGSTGGSGSPITVVSETNKFQNVIAGVNLNVKDETPDGEFVTVTTGIDVSGIKASIQGFLDAYNDANKFIDDQNKYDQETETGGVLLGDRIVQSMQYSLRNVLSSRVNSESERYRYLSSIGIRTGQDGSLAIKDSNRLEEALRNDLDEVISLFTDSGYASTGAIEFVSSSAGTHEGDEYSVDITRAATQGRYAGVDIVDPGATPLVIDATNNHLRIRVNGKLSDDIILSARSYDTTAELVDELQQRIDSDIRIGSAGVEVSWVDTGSGEGHLELTSTMYGSKSLVSIDTTVSNGAAATIGLSTGVATSGQDVAGTINGEEAVGSGQNLTGAADNATTAGLKLKITLTEDQVTSGAEGTITLAKGMASKLNTMFDSLTAKDEGLLDSRITAYENQVENLTERIAEFDVRLAARRQSLLKQFQEMETALAQLSSQGDYITSQVENFNANWSAMSKN
ncbi:MAG: flagellar filament capping protein FliD [candidate division Zixibacteria bacterium]|nr:flagellar filament capping protein FliD [candidate division Zixibacteria bacterium]